MQTLEGLKAKMQTLQQMAQQYGLSLDTHEEEQKQYSQLLE